MEKRCQNTKQPQKTWVESLKPEDEHQEKTWKSLAERNDVHKKVEVEKAQNPNPNMEKNSHQEQKTSMAPTNKMEKIPTNKCPKLSLIFAKIPQNSRIWQN